MRDDYLLYGRGIARLYYEPVTVTVEDEDDTGGLDEVSMRGARGLLISITGGPDLTLYEVDEAATRIREEVDPEANIILGATFDESLEGVIRCSVVATGIDNLDSATQPAESLLTELAGRLRNDNRRLASPIDKFIRYFQTRGRSRFELYLSRSGKYTEMMRGILARYGLPEDLGALVRALTPKPDVVFNALLLTVFLLVSAKEAKCVST